MIYGYARVSSRGQATNGNSLEDQERQLRHEGCTEVIKEQYTGTTIERPKFEALIERLQAGDTLKVTKLDRFARTAADGSKLVKELLQRGVKVHILNIGLIDDTSTGHLIANIMLAFAEFERDMIVERTQAGRRIAMQRPDYQNGRPLKYDKARREHAIQLLLSGHSYNQVANETGISKSTLIRIMRKQRAEHA